jgi:hypothetical protein
LIENSSLFETGNRYLKKFFSELMTKSSAYAELFVCQQFLKKVCSSLLATNPQLFLDKLFLLVRSQSFFIYSAKKASPSKLYFLYEHFAHFSTQEP